MKRYIAAVALVVFIAASLFAVPVYADDSIFDKIGDWIATRGKEDPEKSLIITKRQAERAAKRAEKELQKRSEEMSKGMKKAFGK